MLDVVRLIIEKEKKEKEKVFTCIRSFSAHSVKNSSLSEISEELGNLNPQVEKAAMVVGVDWARWPLQDLQCIARGLGGAALAGMCRLLLDDYSAWAHGLPDLWLWRPHDAGSQGVRLVEVKGPGDVLSPFQSKWIDELLSLGVDVAVARIN